MGALLRRCGRLKSVRGLGLALEAKDFGEEGKAWACLGMEELQIEIHGVSRLTPRQEQLLFEQCNIGNVNVTEERKEYHEALTEQERCDTVRHRVLDQLSRLQELRLLDLSFQALAYKRFHTRFCLGSCQLLKDRIPLCDHPVPKSLSLALLRPPLHPLNAQKSTTITRLEQLATLKRLEEIGFKAVEHGIEAAEMRWMSETWSRMKTVLGMAGVRYKGHETGHQDCRCLDQDVLPVRVRDVFEEWVRGVEFPQEEA